MTKTILLAAALILWATSPSYAGTVIIDWDAAVGATGHQVQQSIDLGTTWTLNTAVATCTGTPLKCVATVILPDTGYILTRVVETNGVGSAIRYDAGVWHCKSCSPPTTTAKNIGAQ